MTEDGSHNVKRQKTEAPIGHGWLVLFRSKNMLSNAIGCTTCGRERRRHNGWKIFRCAGTFEELDSEMQRLIWAFGADFDFAVQCERDWLDDVGIIPYAFQ
jgi:hypothetical protein